jgi:hypothetical protein
MSRAATVAGQQPLMTAFYGASTGETFQDAPD